MAPMYPNPIDPTTKSDAERALYTTFRDQLDDSYTVFHSVACPPSSRGVNTPAPTGSTMA
jgi:hypothetical protein